jgi:hypothetical protein
METFIRARNLESICFDIKKYKFSAKRKIQIDIVKLFCKFFVNDRNTYIAAFVANRLEKLSMCNGDGDLFYKLITEIYIFFATVNHPINTDYIQAKKKQPKSHEVDHMKMRLTMLRTREETIACIDQLYGVDSVFLWQFVRSRSVEKQFCKDLEDIYNVSDQKGLLFAAYDSFYYTYTYNTSIYKNIVFQCMLKIPFLLHEDESELNVKLHKTCLNYVPHIDSSCENPLHTHTTTKNTHEIKTVRFKRNLKKCDSPTFEKVSSDSLYNVKQPMN